MATRSWGENDFDQRIVDWLAEAFQTQHGIDLRRDRQALQRLIEASEKAEQELSGVLARRSPCPSLPPVRKDLCTSRPPSTGPHLNRSVLICSTVC